MEKEGASYRLRNLDPHWLWTRESGRKDDSIPHLEIGSGKTILRLRIERLEVICSL